jgi:hypothetical protein
MRRFAFLLALLGVTVLANSAVAQDSTHRDTTHQPVHRLVPATSKGEVDSVRHKPPLDTAKIRTPTRRDSAFARQEMRADTASIARDTIGRPRPDSQPKKPPPR